jgi:hypothetical protein
MTTARWVTPAPTSTTTAPHPSVQLFSQPRRRRGGPPPAAASVSSPRGPPSAVGALRPTGRRLGCPPHSREVEDDIGAAHAEGGAVVGARGLDGNVVRAEPHARAPALRVADLRHVLAPRPLPHAAVLAVVIDGRRRCHRRGGRRRPLA